MMLKIYQKKKTVMIKRIRELIVWSDADMVIVAPLVKPEKKYCKKNLWHLKIQIYAIEAVVCRFSSK